MHSAIILPYSMVRSNLDTVPELENAHQIPKLNLLPIKLFRMEFHVPNVVTESHALLFGSDRPPHVVGERCRSTRSDSNATWELECGLEERRQIGALIGDSPSGVGAATSRMSIKLEMTTSSLVKACTHLGFALHRFSASPASLPSALDSTCRPY
jgi:hypothetical protein